jgi:hypothetical protein
MKLVGHENQGIGLYTDLWIYQRWDQVPRGSKYPYKHGPLDIPDVGSGV